MIFNRLHLLRYALALGCFGETNLICAQTKMPKGDIRPPQQEQVQKVVDKRLQGEAFKPIANKNLPKHIINYLLNAHRKQLFYKSYTSRALWSVTI